MSSLRATVILPTTGDRGALLELSVPTVLNQSVRELELFIAGDGVSDAARATIRHLMAADPRIRFFDHPKDTRRGELRRHAMLQEARGRIVGYLCDRDLMLPHHVETLERLLTTADFAHTLRFGITPEGGTQFLHTLDVSDPQDRARLNEVDLLIPLSFAGHTLDMYRRLPHGWRATPPGVPTDRYMWEQFLEHPNCRAAVSFEPTVLYFKRGDHPGWPVARRAEELQRWRAKLDDPAWFPAFREAVRDAAIRDRSRLDAELRASGPDGLRRWLWWRFPTVLGWMKAHRTPSALLRAARQTLVPLSLREARARRKAGRPAPSRAHLDHEQRMESAALGDHLRLDVSWVAEPFGPGPRAAVYAGDDELMRLDCFGKDQGHMHLNLKQSRLAPEGGAARLSFPPGSVEEHIRRAEFELRHNLRYAIQVNRDPRVRAITVSDATLDQAAAWMGERMRALVASAAQANQPASQPLEPPVGTRR